MTMPSPTDSASLWRSRLEDLARRVRLAAQAHLTRRGPRRGAPDFARPTGRGVGDWTFALDEGPEAVATEWLLECAREGPLSLLTEDAGWRHRGPGPNGTSTELAGFDHGGPRLALDPVDGTRNLMFELRPAWTVISFAGPGAGEPCFGDLCAGLVAEIPPRGETPARELWGVRGAGVELVTRAGAEGLAATAPSAGSGATAEPRDLARSLAPSLDLAREALRTDDDDRADDGFFCFFSYDPRLRPAIASVAADFFARLERDEGARRTSCYDDQYISSGGQLALLALGSYRMIVDARTHSRRWADGAPQTAKPYDMAGAALCALEAGACVTALDGSPLDFPIDAATPVDFVGFANEGTRARLAPHLAAALARRDAGNAG